MRGNKRLSVALTVGASLLLGACASGFTNVAPTSTAQAQRLGNAEGSACGTMLLGPTAYNFIPAGLNSRVERAYADALSNVPGATALTDVTVQENWYWWIIGTSRCVTVKGEAVK